MKDYLDRLLETPRAQYIVDCAIADRIFGKRDKRVRVKKMGPPRPNPKKQLK